MIDPLLGLTPWEHNSDHSVIFSSTESLDPLLGLTPWEHNSDHSVIFSESSTTTTSPMSSVEEQKQFEKVALIHLGQLTTWIRNEQRTHPSVGAASQLSTTPGGSASDYIYGAYHWRTDQDDDPETSDQPPTHALCFSCLWKSSPVPISSDIYAVYFSYDEDFPTPAKATIEIIRLHADSTITLVQWDLNKNVPFPGCSKPFPIDQEPGKTMMEQISKMNTAVSIIPPRNPGTADGDVTPTPPTPDPTPINPTGGNGDDSDDDYKPIPFLDGIDGLPQPDPKYFKTYGGFCRKWFKWERDIIQADIAYRKKYMESLVEKQGCCKPKRVCSYKRPASCY